MATPFIIKSGVSTALPDDYISGTLYFCTDTKEIYMDTTNAKAGRICITNQELETKVANLIEDLAELTETVTSENQTIKTSISELNNETIKTINVQSDTIALTGNEVTIPAASTSAYGVTKLSSATNSTSTTLAATPKAVKTAYDLANTANTAATNAQSTADTVGTTVANITPITLKNYELGSQGELWIRNTEGIDSDIVDTSIYNVYIDIPIAGVTADMIPEVIFDANVALSGDFAPIAKTGENFVRLYSNTAYVGLTVPIITCRAPGTIVEVTA